MHDAPLCLHHSRLDHQSLHDRVALIRCHHIHPHIQIHPHPGCTRIWSILDDGHSIFSLGMFHAGCCISLRGSVILMYALRRCFGSTHNPQGASVAGRWMAWSLYTYAARKTSGCSQKAQLFVAVSSSAGHACSLLGAKDSGTLLNAGLEHAKQIQKHCTGVLKMSALPMITHGWSGLWPSMPAYCKKRNFA